MAAAGGNPTESAPSLGNPTESGADAAPGAPAAAKDPARETSTDGDALTEASTEGGAGDEGAAPKKPKAKKKKKAKKKAKKVEEHHSDGEHHSEHDLSFGTTPADEASKDFRAGEGEGGEAPVEEYIPEDSGGATDEATITVIKNNKREKAYDRSLAQYKKRVELDDMEVLLQISMLQKRGTAKARWTLLHLKWHEAVKRGHTKRRELRESGQIHPSLRLKEESYWEDCAKFVEWLQSREFAFYTGLDARLDEDAGVDLDKEQDTPAEAASREHYFKKLKGTASLTKSD